LETAFRPSDNAMIAPLSPEGERRNRRRLKKGDKDSHSRTKNGLFHIFLHLTNQTSDS
jgi:hypothetical protein